MSTAYYVYCGECGRSSQTYAHSPQPVKAAIQLWPHLSPAIEDDTGELGLAEWVPDAFFDGAPWDFISDHYSHAGGLAVCDEYGYAYNYGTLQRSGKRNYGKRSPSSAPLTAKERAWDEAVRLAREWPEGGGMVNPLMFLYGPAAVAGIGLDPTGTTIREPEPSGECCLYALETDERGYCLDCGRKACTA